MAVKIIETNWNWASALSDRPRTDYIVLHHAEATVCSAIDVDSWHKSNGWSGIGYHFFVRKNGDIYRGRPLNKMGAHVSGMNSRSIGICAEGSYMKEVMPQTQKKAICELLVYLKDNFYPMAVIVGHKEIGSSDCPGANYPLEEIRNNYRTIAGETTEYTDVNDIIWELNYRGIISNSDMWIKRCGEEDNIYWFCRKLCHYIRTKTRKETEKNEYTMISAIIWDLNYRGIISDTPLWAKFALKDSNVYWLLRKGLHYVRTH